MNKKTIAVIAVILGSIALIGGGLAFAYFSVAVGGSGNTTNNETEITTIRLGTVVYNGQSTFTSENLYPGQIGLQTFTIGPDSQSGTGIYEIDLAGTLPAAFGTDVEITLYKTTDPDNNNVSITEGNITQSGNQVSKVDTLNVVGTPEVVYGPTSLTNDSAKILEQVYFDTDTLSETTYYLVYNYKNNGDQNDQQGLTFSGTVTVKIVMDNEPIIASVKLESIYDKNSDVDGANSVSANGVGYTVERLATKTGGVATMHKDDPDGNIRYMGTNPNNYVSFNGELWRIIGVFDVENAATGKTEKRVKIIRESIGTYVWDTSSEINGTYGVNQWGASTLSDGSIYDGADMMVTLNSATNGYLNANGATGVCYGAANDGAKDCVFGFEESQIKPLGTEAQAMISEVVWTLGASTNDWQADEDRVDTTSQFYASERSTTLGKLCTTGTYCTDTINRTASWSGLVGLMYPSDYGYSTSGGSTTDRQVCLSTMLSQWSQYEDCYVNSWLYDSTQNQWTMTPVRLSNHAAGVISLISDGRLASYRSSQAYAIRPVVYLSTDVLIVGGSGTIEDEFQLSL